MRLSAAAARASLPVVCAAGLLGAGLACATVLGPRPAVAWNPDPGTLVLSASGCCGPVPAYVAENYIPAVRVWGDGRLVWVERNSNGGRRVLTATLTPDQLTALLQPAVEAGFFGWQDAYGEPDRADGTAQCLTVALASVTKQVCEYYEGAPEAFHVLYTAAANGAGAAGAAYAPTQGYVTVYPQTYSMPPTGDDYLLWPADSLGLALADNAGGQWLEGAALAFAWRVVTGDTWQPLVREGDQYFLLTLRIPGVTQLDPPTPPPAAP